MKKKIFLLLTFLFCLCAALTLTACGGTETPGGDEGGDTPATPGHTHTYDAENTCVCGYYKDKGVRFTLSNGTYTVTDYTGTATEVVIPATYKGIAVTSIGERAFYWCSQLTTITIPASVTSIGNYAFYDCSSLTAITIPASVASIGSNPFAGCDKLTTLTVQSGNAAYYMSGNCLIERASKTLIAGFANSVIPTDGSVTSIGDWAFSSCSKLTAITIPDSVTSIGNGAFNDCSKLTTVTFGASSKLTSIGEYAFSSCSQLTAVYISDLAAWCNIEFGSPVANPLRYAKNLYVNGQLVTALEIISGVTTIKDYAFYNCDSLTSVTIPDSVTGIGDGAFYNCTQLTTITISASVTSIGNYAFDGCSQLTTVTFGANSKLTSIGFFAFEYCSRLTTITIPDSVTSIGDWAFYDCYNLTTVYYGGSASDWGKIMISSYGNSDLTSATRYYYSATQPTEAGNWWYYDQNGKPAVWP